ncbi:MAG: hypothetical protein ABJA67_13970, partial [Chthonomonadales bacterium]
RLGQSADKIASEYDLSLSEVDVALSYYFDNRPENDESISASDAFINTMRQRSFSNIHQRIK